jgi:hypothetical protein
MKVAEKDNVVHGMLEDEYISEKDLPELQKQIEEREKYRKEILAYKQRMSYLEKSLKKPNREGGHDKSTAR